MIKQWSFSLLLGLVYLGIFHLWMILSRPVIILSGIITTLLLALVFGLAWKRNYFRNRWDGLFHALVMLDVLLEAILIPAHDHFGFYWCALGFAVVLGGYRAYLDSTKARPVAPS